MTTTESTTPTADVRELARETIAVALRWQQAEDEAYGPSLSVTKADAILAAIAAKGITLCGPGMVVLDEEDFSFLWRAVKAAEALRDDVQWPRPSLQPHALNISFIGEALTVLDNVRAALSAGDAQDGEVTA